MFFNNKLTSKTNMHGTLELPLPSLLRIKNIFNFNTVLCQ